MFEEWKSTRLYGTKFGYQRTHQNWSFSVHPCHVDPILRLRCLWKSPAMATGTATAPWFVAQGSGTYHHILQRYHECLWLGCEMWELWSPLHLWCGFHVVHWGWHVHLSALVPKMQVHTGWWLGTFVGGWEHFSVFHVLGIPIDQCFGWNH